MPGQELGQAVHRPSSRRARAAAPAAASRRYCPPPAPRRPPRASSAMRSRSPTRSSGFEMVSIRMQPGFVSAIFCSHGCQIADVDEIRPPRPSAPAPASAAWWWRRRARSPPAPTCADPSAPRATPRESPSCPTSKPARYAPHSSSVSSSSSAACAWDCRSGRSRSPALRGPARDPAWRCLRRGRWWPCRWAWMTERRRPARSGLRFRSPACTALVSIFICCLTSFSSAFLL